MKVDKLAYLSNTSKENNFEKHWKIRFQMKLLTFVKFFQKILFWKNLGKNFGIFLTTFKKIAKNSNNCWKQKSIFKMKHLDFFKKLSFLKDEEMGYLKNLQKYSSWLTLNTKRFGKRKKIAVFEKRFFPNRISRIWKSLKKKLIFSTVSNLIDMEKSSKTLFSSQISKNRKIRFEKRDKNPICKLNFYE